MALPIVAASLVGSIVAGFAQFFANRAGLMLAGLGLTFVGVKSLQVFIGYVITDMQNIVGLTGSFMAGGSGGSGQLANLAHIAVQLMAYAGLFDAINILIAGYMSFSSLVALRFVLARLK